jgi:hypothetical protein
MSSRVFLLLIAALAIATTAAAQVTKTKDGFLLRTKWKKGDAYSFAMVTTAEFNGQKMPMNGEVAMKATAVTNGIADILVTGNMPPRGPFSATTQADDRGLVSTDERVAELGTRLPEKPVKIGGSWTDTRDLTEAGVEMDVKTTYTLKGLEIVDDVPCVVIAVSIKTSGTANATGTGTTYIETRNGQLFKSEMKMNIVVEGQGAKYDIRSTTTIKRK